MTTEESHQTAHGLKGDSGPPSDMVEPKLVGDAQKDLLVTEGFSNTNESWCYWVPFPGVRYYCYGKPASTVGPVDQSERRLPK